MLAAGVFASTKAQESGLEFRFGALTLYCAVQVLIGQACDAKADIYRYASMPPPSETAHLALQGVKH